MQQNWSKYKYAKSHSWAQPFSVSKWKSGSESIPVMLLPVKLLLTVYVSSFSSLRTQVSPYLPRNGRLCSEITDKQVWSMRINSAIQAAIDLTAGAAGNAGENLIAQNFWETVLMPLRNIKAVSSCYKKPHLQCFKDMRRSSDLSQCFNCIPIAPPWWNSCHTVKKT